jgi:hypothetical protein
MNSSPENQPEPVRSKNITVPREPPLDGDDDPAAPRDDRAPAAGSVNILDEDYAASGKPLPPDSPIAKALHAHPPRAKDELDVGTAGDAARPTKDGITPTQIPPRGHL